MTEKTNIPKKKKFKFPHAFVLLFAMIILVGILTYIIPAGQYDRIQIDGRSVVDPDSFHYIKQTPVKPFEFFMAIPNGLQEASTLIFMILLIGGAIRVFDGSGAIRAAIMKLSQVVGEDKSSYILVAIMIFFTCLGAFPGMLEAVIPFAPLCIGISLALGYDILIGITISLGGIVIGWTAGPSNPWTVGIGHTLGELPMFSGIGFRVLILLVFIAILSTFVLKYGKKIKEDPTKSLVYGIDTDNLIVEHDNSNEFIIRDKLVLITFGATIFFIVFGSLNWGWALPQMSATYIIGAIIGGIFAGYNSEKIADEIIEGAKSILIGALAVGIARGISVVMTDGNIIDTVVYGISSLLDGLPTMVTAIGMFIIQTIINFFIPSGSGQAMATLPIILPVADIIGLNRQIAILAFQFGDGLSNLIYPTVGPVVACLMYAKVPFNKWLKYIMPFVLISWLVATALLIISVLINFGPF
ncbi:AbgT family transporter [Schnuerera sp. xch1]|uniref:YfcC family protein n=1 Tax=Schnuerera sp. xch1 TaxID=2874283 RepID=UPI001CBCEB19|nr:AbgT family transporter [Schnuerera sp. xch1]MBZ2175171.1 AbgT family transporter [Schnuerera sp. xch1]